MKNIMLASVAAGGLALLLAGPAAAQNANGAASPAITFTMKSVTQTQPFGKINVFNVGVDPAEVAAWTKTLSASEKQEMVGRCAVVIQNQQSYFWETASFCQNLAIAIAQ